jgi:hypothetical protein
MFLVGYFLSLFSHVFGNVFGEGVFLVVEFNVVTSLSWVEIVTIRLKTCDSSYIQQSWSYHSTLKLEGVGGFLIKMQCSNEQFWFILGAGSTKLNKRKNTITPPNPLIFLFYSIQPRNIIFVSCVRCRSKQFNRVFEVPKVIRGNFEYPRPTGHKVRKDVVYLFRHAFSIWVGTTEGVNILLHGEWDHDLGSPNLLGSFVPSRFRDYFFTILTKQELLPFPSKWYFLYLIFSH